MWLTPAMKSGDFMKNCKRIFALLAVCLLGVVMLLSSASVSAVSDDERFEKELKAFPTSYHPYLRQLHKEYPKWSFQAFDTGLDWETVIDNEHSDYSLVYNPDSARIFKSLDPDDYDAANDRFYYKDGSFVAASRIAVEYFMDPRNFLDIGGIFQFELLSFGPLYSVEMVEAVLDGSFMDNTKITWVDKNGKKYTGKKTYAQVIYEAGKTYDINPCFLASKILNEVGYNGSASVSGKHDTYPGYYNFYNIGATDGAGAIGRGLYWASGGSSSSKTYSRPWTTPEKSIMGGAEFLAEEYIAAGQYTGYLQRFNVNKESDYQLYTHQYMTNLTGALSQGYSTYKSYKAMGMLSKSLTFSIPVFDNMSNSDGSGKLKGAESTEQYGTINRDYRYVRKGPSVDHDVVINASGESLVAPKGTEVKILEKCDTDAYYYEEILAYPYWYKISFKSGSKTYTGYIPSSRIDVVTAVHVKKGTADIAFAKSSSVKNQIAASDPSMVKIVDSDTVEFLKNGFVTLYIYDSWGHIEEIRFKVGNYASYYSSSPKVTVSGTKVTVTSAKHSDATGYGYTICDKYGNIRVPVFSTKNSRVFENLTAGAVYDVFVQNRYSKYIFTKAVQLPAVLKPSTVKNVKFTKDSSLNIRITWSKVPRTTYYQVASYNEDTGKYTAIVTLSGSKNSYTISASQAAKADQYAVRAYSKYDGVKAFGSYSSRVALSSKAPVPSGLTFSNHTTSGYTVKWTGNKQCDGYEVYVAKSDKAEPYLYKTVTGTSLKISGFKKPTFRQFKVRSFVNTSAGRVYSDFTALASVVSLPAQPQNLKLSSTSTTVKASWDAVEGAKNYKLTYWKTGSSKKTVTVSGTSYTLKSLSGYTEYNFYVSAVAQISSVSAQGSACNTVKIRTKPSVPKNLKVTYQGYNHIDLKWDGNSSLTSYRIYCYDSAGKLVGSVDTTASSRRIKALSPLKTYKFKIRGVKTVDGKNYYSDYSSAVTSKTVIPVVQNIKVSKVTEKSFLLSWDKLEGVTNYNLYYEQDGAFKRIMKPTTNSCTVTCLPASSKGTFYLTATFGKGDNAKVSDKSEIFTASVLPSKVTGITVTPSTESVAIKWNKVKNATGYVVYLVEDGKYLKKKTVKTNSYTLSNLESASSVRISVKAYISTTKGNFYSPHSEKSFYTKPLNVTKITQSNKADTSFTLKWTKSSENVNRYYIYRYNASKKKYEQIAYTKNTSYALKNLTPATTAKYTVIAAVVKDGKIVTKSETAHELSCSTTLPKTENLRLAQATTSSVKLAWNKVAGAEGYCVYYYSAAEEAFKLYKEVKTTDITISGLKSKKANMFRVRAIKRTENATFYGLYSSNLVASTK